jgi:hypothetical protein
MHHDRTTKMKRVLSLFGFVLLGGCALLARAEEAAGGSEVVLLTSENFEHLTQASTGATTGDWLLDFYAV